MYTIEHAAKSRVLPRRPHNASIRILAVVRFQALAEENLNGRCLFHLANMPEGSREKRHESLRGMLELHSVGGPA